MKRFAQFRYVAWMAPMVAVVFLAIDLNVELGIATAVGYLVVILLEAAGGSRRSVWAAAIACTLLTCVGYALSTSGSEPIKIIANRGLAIVAIWTTAIACAIFLRQAAEQRRRTEVAEELAAELARQRQEDARKQRALEDVMEALRSEREMLAASEFQTRTIIDSALDSVVVIDRQGVVVDWNPQAERTFGWSRDEAVDRSLSELIVPPSYREAHRQGMSRFLKTGEERILNRRIEMSAVRRDGSEFPIELTVSLLKSPGEVHFSAFIGDLTERKQADEVRNLLAAIVESSDDAIIGLTLDGKVTGWNRGAEALFGYTSDEMVGQPIAQLAPVGQVDRMPRAIERIGNGAEVNPFECERTRKNGAPLTVSLNVSPIKGASGKNVGASAIARDVTARKRLEASLRKLNHDLEQSNSELEHFAFVASHDLQEPLRKISSFCQLLREEQGDRLDDEGLEYLDVAIHGAERLRVLVRDLLAFSRITTRGKPLGPVDANACLQSAISLLESAIDDSDARITVDSLPTVMADESQFVHLWQNLLGNAIKYRGDRRPEIHVSGRQCGDEFEFTVCDNGIGIAKEFYQKIFIVFQRLHNRREYSGTGIGLALCKRIVERFGGRIWLESTPGVGTKFYFTMSLVMPQGGNNVTTRELEFAGSPN